VIRRGKRLAAGGSRRLARRPRLLRAQQADLELTRSHPLRVVADRDAGDLLWANEARSTIAA
jgi:hypothetical protein